MCFFSVIETSLFIRKPAEYVHMLPPSPTSNRVPPARMPHSGRVLWPLRCARCPPERAADGCWMTHSWLAGCAPVESPAPIGHNCIFTPAVEAGSAPSISTFAATQQGSQGQGMCMRASKDRGIHLGGSFIGQRIQLQLPHPLQCSVPFAHCPPPTPGECGCLAILWPGSVHASTEAAGLMSSWVLDVRQPRLGGPYAPCKCMRAPTASECKHSQA